MSETPLLAFSIHHSQSLAIATHNRRRGRERLRKSAKQIPDFSLGFTTLGRALKARDASIVPVARNHTSPADTPNADTFLTTQHAVAPMVKNTQSSGLEVLKGRDASIAPVARNHTSLADTPNADTPARFSSYPEEAQKDSILATRVTTARR